MTFSVHDHDEIEINLFGTETVKWPSAKSKEIIKGRKCFEFSWKGGNGYIFAGFSQQEFSVFYYSYKPTAYISIRNNSNIYNETQFYIDESNIEIDEHYMICLDTFRCKFYFINGTRAKVVPFPKRENSQFRVLFAQAAGVKNDTVVGYFKERSFVHEMPPSFFSVTDWRNREVLTCRNRKNVSNTLLLICLLAVSEF